MGIELLERIGGDAVLQAAGIPGCFVDGDPGVAQRPLEEAMPRTRRLSDSPPLRREANVMVDDLDKALILTPARVMFAFTPSATAIESPVASGLVFAIVTALSLKIVSVPSE